MYLIIYKEIIPYRIQCACYQYIYISQLYRSYTHFIRFHAISPKAIICRSVSLCPDMIAKRVQNTAFEKFQQFFLISGEYKSIREEREKKKRFCL